MIIRVSTASGSFYDIDLTRREFSRNGDTRWSQILDWRTSGDNVRIPFEDWKPIDWPVVGESMYIQGRGLSDWFLSTPVVSIQEHDGETMKTILED